MEQNQELPPLLQSHLKSIIKKAIDEAPVSALDETKIHSFHSRLSNILQIIRRCNKLCQLDELILNNVKKADSILESMIEKKSAESYKSPNLKKIFKGRPAFLITDAQLQMYIENGFTVPQIATMLSISKSTIRRRLRKFGISINQSYSNLTDDQLDLKIKDLISKFPNCGYRRMNGFLLAASIRIQEKRIQQSMRRVDPNGVLLRSLQISFTNRRQYNGPAALSLWHIDGHHKLIRCVSSKTLSFIF